MSLKLLQTTTNLTSPSTFLLEQVICFPGYIVWLYFDSGDHQTWDIYNKKLLYKGKIEADPTLKFHYFTHNSVVYYSKKNNRIEMLNIVTNKFSGNFDYSKLPTMTALPKYNRQDAEKTENLQSFTKVAIFTQSKLIAVLEPKSEQHVFSQHVVTIFKESQQTVFKEGDQQNFANQLVLDSGNQPLSMIPFNKKDTIALYSPCQMNKPIEFILWNFSQKENAPQKYQFKNIIECDLIDARPWKVNQMAFFVNKHDNSKSEMIIYDIESGEEIENMELTSDESMISEIYVVNPEQDVVLFENFAETVELCMFDTRSKQIIQKQDVEGDSQIALSQDNKYFVGIEDNYNGPDSPNRAMAMQSKITSLSDLKYEILFMLESQGYTKEFDTGVIQNVIDMLTQ